MTSANNTAKDNVYESLSALVDGEASELEVRRLLKSQDAGISQRWQQYHLISAAIKKESVSLPLIDVSEAVSAAIANESVPKVSQSTGVWSNLGRFGIAASVAGALIVGLQLTSVQAPLVADAPAAVSGNPVLNDDTSVRVVSQNAPITPEKPSIVINEATQEQLQTITGEVNRLMLEHAQHATQNTQQGILPYVRVPDSE